MLEYLFAYWIHNMQSVFVKWTENKNIFDIDKMVKYVVSNVFTYGNDYG